MGRCVRASEGRGSSASSLERVSALSGAKRAAYGSLQPDGKAKPSKERHCKNCGAPMKGHPRDGLRLVCPYPPKED